MTSGVWFYKDDEFSIGPLSEDGLAQLLARKILTRDAAVRLDNDGETWRALSDVFDFARQTAPPLPDPSATADGEWDDAEPHPWRRYFARMLDIALLGGLCWGLIGFVVGALDPDIADRMVKSFEGRAGLLLSALATVPLSMAWSAVFLAFTGTTPGKMLFGVRVLTERGAPPGLLIAAEREARVWLTGLGCSIPFVSFATLILSFTRLDSKKRTLWDEDLRLVVTHRPEGALQVALGAFGIVLWIAINITMRLLSQ